MTVDKYAVRKLFMVKFVEIEQICIALDFDYILFEGAFFDWYESSPLSSSMALDMCKMRLLAGLPLPWEAAVIPHWMPPLKLTKTEE